MKTDLSSCMGSTSIFSFCGAANPATPHPKPHLKQPQTSNNSTPQTTQTPTQPPLPPPDPHLLNPYPRCSRHATTPFSRGAEAQEQTRRGLHRGKGRAEKGRADVALASRGGNPRAESEHPPGIFWKNQCLLTCLVQNVGRSGNYLGRDGSRRPSERVWGVRGTATPPRYDLNPEP